MQDMCRSRLGGELISNPVIFLEVLKVLVK